MLAVFHALAMASVFSMFNNQTVSLFVNIGFKSVILNSHGNQYFWFYIDTSGFISMIMKAFQCNRFEDMLYERVQL
jgi:hypothetical protein